MPSSIKMDISILGTDIVDGLPVNAGHIKIRMKVVRQHRIKTGIFLNISCKSPMEKRANINAKTGMEAIPKFENSLYMIRDHKGCCITVLKSSWIVEKRVKGKRLPLSAMYLPLLTIKNRSELSLKKETYTQTKRPMERAIPSISPKHSL